MSGANAISGIALVGALMLSAEGQIQNVLAFFAILFASINVFGGYLVTNRMLACLKRNLNEYVDRHNHFSEPRLYSFFCSIYFRYQDAW